ncbi:hypothetical protein T492DRAFT_899043 [Pavlovales sp. CCMP2436]|nr:hypothetical protein T492DRAFT_899043 [Pavlovales sp. CCMP2436]
MPKNKGKGGKNRRRGKNDNDSKRELTYKEDGQEYAQVIKMLGNGRLEAFCFDGVSRLCHIRGKLRKRVWIQQGDIVLLGYKSTSTLGWMAMTWRTTPSISRRSNCCDDMCRFRAQ